MKYLIYFFILIIVGCKPYKSLKIEIKNPTEYVFDIDTISLKATLINSFSKKHYKGMNLVTINTDSIFNIFDDTIKLKSNNILLYNDSYKLSSSVYYKKNRKLRYYASFLIVIEGLDSIKTKIKIKTIHPNILIGRRLFPQLPHFVRYEKTKYVQPSTIEEYELLLYIGKLIGINNMPIIKYPVGYYELQEPYKPWE